MKLNKTSTGSKPLRISFDRIDRFIRDRGCEFRRLLLFDYGLLDRICESEKSGIADSINHNFGEIRIDSYNTLPMEKILTFHDVIIHFRSVVDENKKKYYYNIYFRERFVQR